MPRNSGSNIVSSIDSRGLAALIGIGAVQALHSEQDVRELAEMAGTEGFGAEQQLALSGRPSAGRELSA
jgi:hypothetical protein